MSLSLISPQCTPGRCHGSEKLCSTGRVKLWKTFHMKNNTIIIQEFTVLCPHNCKPTFVPLCLARSEASGSRNRLLSRVQVTASTGRSACGQGIRKSSRGPLQLRVTAGHRDRHFYFMSTFLVCKDFWSEGPACPSLQGLPHAVDMPVTCETLSLIHAMTTSR